MLRKLYDEEDIEEEKIEKDEEEDSGPIYDTDGEGEFCERINFLVEEEFIEEIEEGTNFVIGDEIVEAIVEEINFVDMHKIVEEMVIFVEQLKSFREITTLRTNDCLSDNKKYGERLDFANYDLDSDVFGPSSWECMEVVFHPQMEDTIRIEFGELFELFEEEHVYVEKRPSWNKEKVTLCNKNLFSRLAVREGSYGGTTQFGSY
ncbi:unnamed protein product [Lactuca saligna]|uniref:Uncharacterized protein n=1 Tax=Lactuca saligna TaxID=75948 RepID=A0AA35Y3P5_LACSI|nr:unnamed protein product [Lactuca saligna]